VKSIAAVLGDGEQAGRRRRLIAHTVVYSPQSSPVIAPARARTMWQERPARLIGLQKSWAFFSPSTVVCTRTQRRGFLLSSPGYPHCRASALGPTSQRVAVAHEAVLTAAVGGCAIMASGRLTPSLPRPQPAICDQHRRCVRPQRVTDALWQTSVHARRPFQSLSACDTHTHTRRSRLVVSVFSSGVARAPRGHAIAYHTATRLLSQGLRGMSSCLLATFTACLLHCLPLS
jgi:hypothetical protein